MKSQKNDTEGESLLKEVTLTPLLTAIFKPTARYLGEELRELVREPIERWKTQKKDQFLRAHIEQVRTRVHEHRSSFPQQQTTASKQADFFSEWAEAVENINPADEDLSQIWQDLMARVACGEEISAELMRALKTLTPGEAQFLMKLRRGPRWSGLLHMRWLFIIFDRALADSLPHHSKRNSRGLGKMLYRRDLFYARTLEEKQLVERSGIHTFFLVFPAIIAAIYWLSHYLARDYSGKISLSDTNFEILTFPLIGSSLLIIVMFFISKQVIRWKLSWLGFELTQITFQSHNRRRDNSDSPKPGTHQDTPL